MISLCVAQCIGLAGKLLKEMLGFGAVTFRELESLSCVYFFEAGFATTALIVFFFLATIY